MSSDALLYSSIREIIQVLFNEKGNFHTDWPITRTKYHIV